MDGLPEKMFSKLTNGLNSAADAIDIFVARMHEWLQQITIHAGLAWKIFIADINSVVALLIGAMLIRQLLPLIGLLVLGWWVWGWMRRR